MTKKITVKDFLKIARSKLEQLDRMDDRLKGIEESVSKLTYPPSDSDKKYKVPAAALYCGMSVSTFRTHIYKRHVAGTKFAKAYLFTKKDLDTFIKNFRRPTKSELENEAIDKLTNKK